MGMEDFSTSPVPVPAHASPLMRAPLVGVLNVIPPAVAEAQDRATAQARIDAQAATLAGPAASSLLSYVQSCRDEAVQAKQFAGVTDRLLDAQRRRANTYDDKRAAQIAKYNLPNVWVPLTQTKCIHCEAWLRDLLLPYGEKTWLVEPSTIPDVPDMDRQKIEAAVEQEALAVMAAGEMVTAEQYKRILDNAVEEYERLILEEAKARAKAMEKVIQDQHEDCDWRKVFREFQSNLVTYGTAFLKGPAVRERNVAKWEGRKRVIGKRLVPTCSAPSPHDIFPAPWAQTEQEGYIVERIRTYRNALNEMRGQKYYNDANIRALLASRVATPTTQPSDAMRNTLENKPETPSDNRVECWQFHGPVPGYMLGEWGIEDVEPTEDYEMEVLWSESYVLQVKPAWNGLGTRPYFRAVFKPQVGSFWGVGVPHLMASAQDRANTLMMAMVDNTHWASGPMGWVDQTRLVNPSDALTWHPRKMIVVKTEPGQTGEPVKWFSLDLKVAELNTQYQSCLADADNESGVPAYMYGSDKAAGAGTTYSGLSTLMNAAARGIKDALLEIDQAVSRFISNWADWLNEYADDPDLELPVDPDTIKGDVRITCSGATGLFVQEMQLTRMGEMLDRAAKFGDVIGPRFLVGIVRQMSKILKIDTTALPTDEELQAAISNAAAAGAVDGGAEQVAPQPGGAL